ncbi:asparagine synthase (glutamine-hydrolyzing) [Actinocorallia longicatena]|uniref:asparagine synthase (glutamine-hydrolyzing) n=1 Tax=Actinocorallia longicatena TaxID=111803 RepID=A0ABP6QBW4_9ACTN
MCGIAGVSGRPDADLVRRMCAAVAHRGPDGEGLYTDDHAALGTRRLAIADGAGGVRPARSENGRIVAVFDGELYNHAELRDSLRAKGHVLAGSADGECLVHLYEEYGDALVHHLRGMFAFAVWDRREERLLLARDRVGQKPLYWRLEDGALEFASELKAIEGSIEIDPVALHHYLTLQYVPAPWSIRRGVEKLPPGHLLTFQHGAVRTACYWRPDATPRPVPEDPAERLRELLLEATSLRLAGERPIGAFLSGGLGSSAVVAAMARLAGTVRTFSIGFADERPGERAHARRVAELFGTDHHEYVVEPSGLEVLPELARAFDEPFADASAVPAHLLARFAAGEVTVALTGDGGGESFGGHERYAPPGRAARVNVPPQMRPALARAGTAMVRRTRARTVPRRAARIVEVLGHDPALRYARMMSCFGPEEKAGLYTPAFAETLAGVETCDLLTGVHERSAARGAARLLDVDVQTYLPGGLLVKADTTTMAHSLLARSPLLDQELMRFAAGLPTELKTAGATTGTLFEDALRAWLPDDLVDRPEQGFGVPLAEWLRTGLRELARDVLTDTTATSRGLFRPERVAGLLDAHDGGDDHSRRLWALLQFELWTRARNPCPA